MSKYIWLIRHSESQGNLERRIQGVVDFPLTMLGRRQAARLAERLAQEEGIKELITSPLQRAAQTAEIVAAVMGVPIRYDDRLKEYNFGPLGGMTREEIARQYPAVWEAWQLNEFWEPLPGEEGEHAFAARVRAGMDDIVAEMDDDGVAAVVMHGGAMNTCLRSWLGIDERGWRTFAFDNAALSLVQLQPKIPLTPEELDQEVETFRMLGFYNDADRGEYNYRMLMLNDVSHLTGLMGSKPTWFSAKRSTKKSSN